MNINKKLSREQKRQIIESTKYRMCKYKDFDFTILKNCKVTYSKKWNHETYWNEVIIACDTETSKSGVNPTEEVTKTFRFSDSFAEIEIPDTKITPIVNWVCAWTISIRADETNIVTLYGTKPTEFCDCIVNYILPNLYGNVVAYFHNLAYDWTFLQKFMIQSLGLPQSQLNTKANYPISIKWENNNRIFELRDSLIISQCKLETWAKNLDVEHKKAVGMWDYDKIRNQQDYDSISFTTEELKYIENDTLALCECIDKFRYNTGVKSVKDMPLTLTGTARNMIKELGEKFNQRARFLDLALTYDQYVMAKKIYAGGFVAGNRDYIGHVFTEPLPGYDYTMKCYDFSSSYPFCMLLPEFETSKYTLQEDCTIDDILDFKDKYCFMFKLSIIGLQLKDDKQMVPLASSKCETLVGQTTANGKVLEAKLVETHCNEKDLQVILHYYNADKFIVSNVYSAKKGYLPKWYRDYVYQLYIDKCTLKGGSPVLYRIRKSILNALYGLCCQSSVKEAIIENYESGEYYKYEGVSKEDYKEIENMDIPLSKKIEIIEKKKSEYYMSEYEKYLNRKSGSNLNYQWGQRVSSCARYNLLCGLGECIDYENGGVWAYSDTDSAYSNAWDLEKLEKYNNWCKEEIRKSGYDCVEMNGRQFWLGVAETSEEDICEEFVTLGAKKYCKRGTDGKLHITLAGVPKEKGAECLGNSIYNFKESFVFRDTGKKTHCYMYGDIREINNNNEVADSIDLIDCNYLLSQSTIESGDLLEDLLTETQYMTDYQG